MLKMETIVDLQSLISNEIQESLTLDYKASASLSRSDDKRKELIKDVCAFANSAGGQITSAPAPAPRPRRYGLDNHCKKQRCPGAVKMRGQY